MTQQLKKITLKAVGVQPAKKPESFGFAVRIFGVANAFKTGQTEYGEFIKFMGEFGAVTADGETFESYVCILPSFAADQLRAQMGEDGSKSVEFAFDFSTKEFDSKYGYEWVMQPSIRPQGSIFDRMAKALPVMPSPTGA